MHHRDRRTSVRHGSPELARHRLAPDADTPQPAAAHRAEADRRTPFDSAGLTMPFRWNYGGPAWASPDHQVTTASVKTARGGHGPTGDSEATGTFRSLPSLPGSGNDGTRSQPWS